MNVKFYKNHKINIINIISGIIFIIVPMHIISIILNETNSKQLIPTIAIISIVPIVGFLTIIVECQQLFKSIKINKLIKSTSTKEKITFQFKGIKINEKYIEECIKTKEGEYAQQASSYLFNSNETGTIAIDDPLNLAYGIVEKINHEIYDNKHEFKINGYLYKNAYYISYNELLLLIDDII